MASLRFPATATLLDAKACSLEKFDALFVKITEERQIHDGYFLQAHPDEVELLFVVNGAPYAAGRISGEERAGIGIADFFTAYARHPESPLSFCVADKRLLLGLMVLFHHEPALTVTVDRSRMEGMLEKLAARPHDAILTVHCGDEWAVSILAKGKPVVTYLPTPAAPAGTAGSPTDQLVAYVESRPQGEARVEVFEETRVAQAGDAARATPEARHRLSEVYLEPVTAPEIPDLSLTLEVAPQPEAPPAPTPEPAPLVMEAPPAAPGPAPKAAAPSAPAEVAPLPKPAAPVAPPAPSPGPAPELFLYLADRHLATFSLAGGELTIGRNPGNDIVVENAGVSRRHAVVRLSGGKISIEDMGSANGTFVNGKKVTTQELRDADEIVIVKHRLVLHVPKEGEAVKAEAQEISGGKTMYIDPAAIAQAVAGKTGIRTAESVTPVLRPRLILPDLKKFALEAAEVTLGSGSDCNIQLSGMFVAKVHARIVPFKEGQYKIVHVAGLSGTRVNGEKITEHTLKHGDEIEIGKSKLLFRIER